ncbi:hypothetical protein FJY84_05235 [Candidatus Bathyarchaeota archaeon]|nr:hypothetical protein [Candidatus Bathyarchaeota archaeon]
MDSTKESELFGIGMFILILLSTSVVFVSPYIFGILNYQQNQQLKPASFMVKDLKIEPKEVLSGNNVTVSAIISNVGEKSGQYNAELFVDGIKEKTADYDVMAGSSVPIEFKIVGKAEGEYTVKLGDQSSIFKVISAGPALFTLTEIIVNPVKCRPGENVTIDFMVKNSGGSYGSYDCKVYVDRNYVDTATVSLIPNQQEWIRMSYSTNSIGGHLVQIADKSAVFTVATDAPSQNTPTGGQDISFAMWIVGGIGVLIVGSVLLGVVAGAFVNSDKSSKRRKFKY